LSSFTGVRLDALLFGESQSRVILTTGSHFAAKVLAQAGILGLPARLIGRVGGDQLTLKTPFGEWTCPVAELHDAWWNSIARAMK
jgi:phosphoribosylformylglycinamidine synthase subunit PurL